MTTETLITIAIPYHQNIGYLKEALQSVYEQTRAPVEVVIIDNSIEGDAEHLLDSFPLNIRYIRSASDLGLASYFNQCLDAAQTQWCTILHADDLLLPHYVETMTKAISQHSDAVGIFSRTHAIDEEGNRCWSPKDWGKQYFWPDHGKSTAVKGEKALSSLLRANYIMCPTVCYNLGVLACRRFDPTWKLLLDLDLYGRLLLGGEHLIGIRKTLYACRRHPAATTSIYEQNFSMFLEGKRCIQSLANKAHEQGWPTAARSGKHKIIYHLYVICTVLCNLRPNNIKSTLKFLSVYARTEDR